MEGFLNCFLRFLFSSPGMAHHRIAVPHRDSRRSLPSAQVSPDTAMGALAGASRPKRIGSGKVECDSSYLPAAPRVALKPGASHAAVAVHETGVLSDAGEAPLLDRQAHDAILLSPARDGACPPVARRGGSALHATAPAAHVTQAAWTKVPPCSGCTHT